MKKRIVFLIVCALCICMTICLCACGGGDNPDPNDNQGNNQGNGQGNNQGGNQGGNQGNTDDPQLKSFTGISFENATFDYDGTEKSVTLTGVPAGAKVTYENNKATDAGEYQAKATVTKEGYKTLTLTAKLVINKINFTGISFEGKTFTYDGQEKTLGDAAGVPEFAECKYTGTRAATDAGTYTATLVVSAKNYNDYKVTATLTINKATLGDFTFENKTFEYDEQLHTIQISGMVPAGESVVYTGGEDGKNGARSVGSYEITATVGGKNYVQKTLTATLKIKSTEEALATIIYNGKVYFQNALDNNRLYVYDGANLEKFSNDIPNSFTIGNGKLYFLTENLFTKGIVSYDGEETKDLFSISGDFLVSDGNYLFYAVSNLLKPSQNGIYRLKIADLTDSSVDPVAERVCAQKAEYLVVVGNYIYFSNKSDGGKLHRVSKLATDSASELVYDYKVSDIAVSDTKLFFTRHITLSNLSSGAAIYSIETAGARLPLTDDDAAVKKITNSKGKYISVLGDWVYFVNTDMLTATIFGDGIYRAKADGSDWKDNVIGGTKIIDAENNNVYALTSDGSNLYYYRANDKHLYRYDGEREVDLMQGFVAPVEENVPTTYYAEMREYNGELYYIDMTDGGRLHKHNLSTGLNTRISNLEVADFAIHDGWLYYATVRLKVNFDLYKVNLTTGENVRISTEKCMHFAFDGNKIYYANFSGSNTLNCMNLDGTNDTILFEDKGVDDYDIYVLNGKIYFVADGELYAYDTTPGSSKIVNKDANPNEFLVLDNGVAFLMNDRATKNYFAKIDLTTGALTTIGDLGATNDARSFFVIGNYVYYYRNVAAGSKNKGLYRVNMNEANPNAELVTSLEGYAMSSAVVVDGKVYFIDAWQIKNSLPTQASTGKIFCLDLNSLEVTEVH